MKLQTGWILVLVWLQLSVGTHQCSDGAIRLVGGGSDLRGRVEICFSSQWGTVCDDYWDTADANVVCRQLGYSPTGAEPRSSAHFGQGYGNIWLDNVQCNGAEAQLSQCSHRGVGNHDCRHLEDAGVVCQRELSVTITVDYTPPPGFTPGPNEYRAASGPVTVTCIAIGGSGTGPSYQWSSTCRNCPFRSLMSSVIIREAVHSSDSGTHTCTVTRGGVSATASIAFNVVGAGIHVFNGDPIGSLPNNGLVVSHDPGSGYRFRFSCHSDSVIRRAGQLIGLNGSTIARHIFLDIDHPQSGELMVENTAGVQVPLPASKQGVYTCRIPLQSGELKEINIGIYPCGFNTPPSISSFAFIPGSSSCNLTCTSTGSPATTVTWMRDGQPLTIDGSTHQMTQTVTNRRESTYENVLTIANRLSDVLGHTYTCTVTNTLGSDSQEHLLPVYYINVIGSDKPLIVGEVGTITCFSGLDVASMQWLFNNEVMIESTSGQQLLDLVFNPVNDSIHNRQYSCRVTADGNVYSDNITVTVEILRFTVRPSLSSYEEIPTAGRPLNITCTLESSYLVGLQNVPTLKWLDPSGTLVTNMTDITVEQRPHQNPSLVLHIDPLRTSHAGVYMCLAELESPAVVETIMESVEAYILVALPIPVLTVRRDPDANMTLRHGNSLTLTCTVQWDQALVDSNVDVTVNGMLSGPRGNSNASTLVSDGVYKVVLEIASLYATSSDAYTCSATVSPASGGANIRNSEQGYATLDISVELDISIEISYTPPPGFTPGPNEYRAASGPVNVTCIAVGGTTYSYQWSSTCRNCTFQTSNSQSIIRQAMHSSDSGIHTCTAVDIAQGRTGSQSVEFIVVGAGIHVLNGGPYTTAVGKSLPDNGLVVSHTRNTRFHFFCRSDSMIESVGELLGLDGISAVTSNSYFDVHNPRMQTGELVVRNRVGVQDPLTSSEQGVYTCRIPLLSGEMREINIGIYPSEFNALPNVLNLKFDPINNALICTSTHSPATTVTWMRDGHPLTIDGTTYQLMQTVTNRRESTYENVLTINDQLSSVGHIFRCTVINVLGSSSEELQALDFPSVTKLEFDPMARALTCTVSATTVNWMRDGQPLTIDGRTYRTVINRITSIESTNINENVLIFNEPQSNIVGHTYTCTASSNGTEGTSSQDFDIVLPPVENITVVTVNATTVNVSWVALELLGWNVSHYTLYYTAFSIGQKRAIGGFSRQYPGNTASVILQPMTKAEQMQHEFHIRATIGMLEGPQSEKASIVFDKEFFQLQIGPLQYCISWQPEKAQNIEAAIQTALCDAISFQCKCTFPCDFIRRGRFSCRNVTTEATYRSTIVGTMSHNASQLVNFIQNWVHSRPAIEVEWWLMDVYTNCPVRISSLTGSECQTPKRLIASNQTLITSDPAVIKCVDTCLYRQKGTGNACQI